MKDIGLNTSFRRIYIVLIVIVGLFPLSQYLYENTYLIHLMIMVFIYAIASVGFNILSGNTGLLSLGHAAFIGIGAYTSANLAVKLGLPFVACLLIAGIVSCIGGAFLGAICLRLEGIYLTIVTLALGIIILVLFRNLEALTGGSIGMGNIPRPAGMSSNVGYYYLSFFVLLITISFSVRIIMSKYGRAFIAVKEDIIAAESCGMNSISIKLLSFTYATFLAGISGSLYAHYMRYITPDAFDLFNSIKFLLIVIIGGYGSIGGSLLGSFVVVMLPETLRFTDVYYYAIFGLIAILVMVLFPGGLISIGGLLDKKVRETRR